MKRMVGKAGLAFIQNWEGLRLKAYYDAAGILTVGYGHTGLVDGKPIAEGLVITQDKAEQLLKADIQSFADAVDSVVYVPFTHTLNANQRDALISFAFNCGLGSLKQLCRNRTAQDIPEHITAYVYGVNRVKLQGLVRRRQAEKVLFETPVEGEEIKVARYQTLNEIPAWGQSTIKKMLQKKLFADGQDLDISLDMLRMLVLLDRAGIFK